MTTLTQRNFSGGELAPVLYSRCDTVKYQTGLRTMRNFFTMKNGGSQNRPGTEFIGEIKDSSKTVRFIKFVFNTSQTYLLEFGNLYVRFIQDGAYITDSTKTITGVSQDTQARVTSVAHGFVNGDQVQVSSVLGMTELNNRTFIVADVTANTFHIKTLNGNYLDSTLFSAYTSGGSAARIYTVTTTYLEADLPRLRYVQSADVLTIVHPSYQPQELSRVAQTNWTFTSLSGTQPSINPPVNFPTIPPIANPADFVFFVVTNFNVDGEESLPSEPASSAVDGSVASPLTFIWEYIAGAVSWKVYKGYSIGGPYGLVANGDADAPDDSYSDVGQIPDFTLQPPIFLDRFNAVGDYPAAVTYAQQRLLLGGSDNNPERVDGSKTGFFKNFTTSFPAQDDDAVSWVNAGRQVNRVKHMIEINRLIVFTEAGEWVIEGGADGAITPGSINPKQHTYNGCGDLAPIVIDDDGLYVQAQGSIVRDLAFDYQVDGYHGNDLTMFSSHLFEGYTIVDWDYQKTPNSIVWAVRDDGTVLGLTYVREQQILAWHRHDFENGTVENVCTVPEGNETAVYFVIKRSVNGNTVRCVERLTTRVVRDVVDSIFMDSALSYDGRNTGSTTMTFSAPTGWAHDFHETVTSSVSFFSAGDVGNELFFTDPDDDTQVRFEIIAYTSPTVVTVRPQRDVSTSLQAVLLAGTTSWARAVDTFSGLWHIEGQDVSVLGDGFVVASPNNNKYDVLTVTNGQVTLDRPYAVVHVGLPITADLQTLDIDTANGETLKGKKMIVGQVYLQLEKTRGLLLGQESPEDNIQNTDDDPLKGLYDLKLRQFEDYDDPVALLTGQAEVVIESTWNSNGSVFIRQVDPLPASVLAIMPDGNIPFKGGQ